MSAEIKMPTRVAVANVKIRGLTNQDVARAIRARLALLDGVVAVRMSITDQSARVEYQPSKLSPSHIAATIGQLGYSTTIRSMLRTM
jgi:cation transport ATPase